MSDDILIGDVVYHKDWNLCLWEVTDIETTKVPVLNRTGRSERCLIADIQLIGGHAHPPSWWTARALVSNLQKAETIYSEMEIIALSSMDLSPTKHTES